jgi:N utilization substance protein A
LAAKLLGWKIDIKSEEEKRQEVELQMSALVGSPTTPLENVTGLGEGLIEKLSAAGVSTVEALADMTPEQLEAIEGIGPKTVEKISLAVNNYFSSLEGGVAEEAAGDAVVDAEGAVAAPDVDPEAPAEGEAAAAAGEEPARENLEAAPGEESGAQAEEPEPTAASDETASDDKDNL